MRLRRLYVREYRVLRDLEIRFGPLDDDARGATIDVPTYTLDFVVGVNGSGKSTVLRALGEIYRHLYGSSSFADFTFEIEYELSSAGPIMISNFDPESKERISGFRFRVGEEERRVDEIEDQYLPPKVIAFTTGSEAEWFLSQETSVPDGPAAVREKLEQKDRAVLELPGRTMNEGRKGPEYAESDDFLLVRAEHMSLMTLCGLLMNYAEGGAPDRQRLQRPLTEVKIETFRGFSLKFRVYQDVTPANDSRFIAMLAGLATRSVRMGADYLLVFDLTGRDSGFYKRILESGPGGIQLFETLVRMATPQNSESPTLQECNIFFERTASADEARAEADWPPMHLLEWLSDGERSFLGRMCLFSLLGETEALILLDEPEVHFNDYWKRQIVYLLNAALAGQRSHVVVATHSSIALTDVPSEDIVVLDRTADYTDRSFHPRIKTFAADPSDIMVHVFGARHAAGEQSVSRLLRLLDSPLDQAGDTRRGELEYYLDRVGAGYWSYRIRRELSETRGQ